jgi:hypothetical protein
MAEPPDRRQEAARRVLGVEPRLEGMAREAQVLLPLRQRSPAATRKLPFDEILAGDGLGHGVLDLQPRVHLHEPEPVGPQMRAIDDELDRAGAGIADRLRGLHRRSPHRRAHLRRHAGRGRLLDHLLVAALQRAVALEQVHGVAVVVAEHLDLDMARRGDVFLDEHRVVAEGRGRLAARRSQRVANSRG